MKIHTKLLNKGRFVFLIFCCVVLPPNTSVATFEVKVDLGLAEVIREARVWWESIEQSAKLKDDKIVKNSAKTLALNYLQIAGLMDSYADTLQGLLDQGNAFQYKENKVYDDELLSQLKILSFEMQKTVTEIGRNIGSLDPDFTIANVDVVDDIGLNQPRRSFLVRRGIKLADVLSDQQQFISPKEILDVINAMKKMAVEARRISNEISDAVK